MGSATLVVLAPLLGTTVNHAILRLKLRFMVFGAPFKPTGFISLVSNASVLKLMLATSRACLTTQISNQEQQSTSGLSALSSFISTLYMFPAPCTIHPTVSPGTPIPQMTQLTMRTLTIGLIGQWVLLLFS